MPVLASVSHFKKVNTVEFQILGLVNSNFLVDLGISEPFYFILGSNLCKADDNEARLMKNLMANYDAGVRPAQNSSLPLTVIFGVSLHHIIDVVSRNCGFSSKIRGWRHR